MARKSKQLAAEIIAEEDAKIIGLLASTPIEVWPIDDVIMDVNNANVHDRRSVEAIRASVAKFGQVEPLLTRKSTGILIAGEGRLLAMQELGYTHVEVRPLDVDATTASMLSLALNRTAELSHFDFQNVAAQLKGFKADNQDIGVLGWADFELAALIDGKPAKQDDGGNGKADGKEFDESVASSMRAIIFTEEQWPVIHGAISKIRDAEDDPDIKENRCIELIAADFLAGS